MDAQKAKAQRAERRRFRVRKALRGTAVKPRLTVFRSNLHIYAQLVDDEKAVTIAAVASNAKDVDMKYGGNVAAATAVGKKLAEKAKEKGITLAVFDRGHYRFHGRIKALARAATEAGLVCTGLEDAPKKQKAAPEAAAAKPAKVKGEGKKPAAAKA